MSTAATTLPTFVSEDPQAIIAAMTADMQSRLNRSIAPADIEQLLINAFAYREQLLRTMINATARQCLVDFATGMALDYLGKLLGVTRLPASASETTIQYNLVPGHAALTLPAGLRVQSIDGLATFALAAPISVDALTNTVQGVAICATPGSAGNAYAPGGVAIILDPQPYLQTASNIDVTTGGSDAETDDQLRARIEEAPAAFSVAGPTEAYEYFAKSANPGIVDVAVDSNQPGTVQIYPLMSGGVIPGPEVLAQVLAVCNGDRVRPLTDTVSVFAPEVVNYDIVVELTVFTDAVQSTVLSQVSAALTQYQSDGLNTLGRDVVLSQINGLCMIEGQVYDVTIVSPAATMVVADNQYASCNSIGVTVIGTNNG